MTDFYVRKIKDGTITLKDVPKLWQDAVKKALR